MKVELEYCERKTHPQGAESVEFNYLIDAGEAQVKLIYDKLYAVEDGFPADWKGINEWCLSISAGADFNIASCGPARWVQYIAAVTLFHEQQEHQDWVLSGKTL